VLGWQWWTVAWGIYPALITTFVLIFTIFIKHKDKKDLQKRIEQNRQKSNPGKEAE